MFNNQGGFNSACRTTATWARRDGDAQPRAAQHDEHQLREHAELAARQPQLLDGRRLRHDLQPRTAQTVVPARRSRSTRPTIRPTACSTRRTSPARPARNLTEARNAVRAAHGPRHVDRRHGTSGCERRASTSTTATSKQQCEDDVDLRIRAGHLEAQAEPDGEPRPALRGAAAVHADHRHLLAVGSGRSICGISGVGDGVGGRGCNMFQPSETPAAPGAVPQYTPFAPGTRASTPTGTTSRPTSASRGSRTSRSGFLRAILGDPDQATIRAGYSWSFNLERIDRFRALRQQPGRHDERHPQRRQRQPASNRAGPGRCCSAKQNRLGPPAICPATVTAACMPRHQLPDHRDDGQQRQHLRCGHQDAARRVVVGGLPALDRPQHGDRSPLPRQPQQGCLDDGELERARDVRERLHGRVPAAMDNLQSHVAAGCSAARSAPCSYAYRGAGTGTSPLPTYLAYFLGRADAANAAAYTRRQLDEHGVHG